MTVTGKTISDPKEFDRYWTSNPVDEDRFDSAEDGMIVTDAEGAIRFVNAAAQNLIGLKIEPIRGQRLTEFFTIINESTRQAIEDPVTRCLDTNDVVILGNHDVMVTREGDEIPIAGSATPICNKSGEAVGSVFVVRDVTPTRLLLRRISYKTPDEGQGHLLSRRQLLQRIEQLLGAMSDIHEHALIMVKCEHLGGIEDRLGVEAGEILSSQLMRLFLSELREDDLLAMLGEDEFGILLTHCPRRQAQWIMRRIKEALHSYRFNWGQATVRLDFRVDILFMYGKDYTRGNRFVSVDSLVFDEDGRQQSYGCGFRTL